MKIIAFYLPQFHEIPENDAWWGKGFTEWVNVKKAKPLFEGHNQPRIPLNNNYYNLLDDNVKQWQVDIANKYGVYGFSFYHYWFDGHMLLEKPVNQFLANKNLHIHFCMCWANEAWTNAWAAGNTKVLIEQRYGTEKEWKEHFEYFLPFFNDERYIKENNKPLLLFYRPELIDCLNDMLDYWDRLAKENGFDGMEFGYQHVSFALVPGHDESRFTYAVEYQPNWARTINSMSSHPKLQIIKKQIVTFTEKHLKINLAEKRHEMAGLEHFSYDEVWEEILSLKPASERSVPGAFVDWDNTPRRGNGGYVADGASPEKFKKYLSRQIVHARDVYHKDKIFIFSWNEWAEGGYLEPDTKNGYGYLQAVHDALEENGELPQQN